MINLMVAGAVLLIVGGAAAYIIKAKKAGARCIGCPSGGCCSGEDKEHPGGCCGCR